MCWVCDPFNHYDDVCNVCIRGRVFRRLAGYYLVNDYSKGFPIRHSLIYPIVTKNAIKKAHDRKELIKILRNTFPPYLANMIIKYVTV